MDWGWPISRRVRNKDKDREDINDRSGKGFQSRAKPSRAIPMAFFCVFGKDGGFQTLNKRIDDYDAVDHLTVLHIFGEQDTAPCLFGHTQDKASQNERP